MLLQISNESRPPQTVADSIYNLLKSLAERDPAAIAIAAPDRRPLAYRRLLRQVEDTVSALSSAGLVRNDRVALVLPNGPEMAVAFLAVACGATCAPLNPAYTEEEFDFYISDLDARALIVASGMDSPARRVAQRRQVPILELVPAVEAEAGIRAGETTAALEPGRDSTPAPDAERACR